MTRWRQVCWIQKCCTEHLYRSTQEHKAIQLNHQMMPISRYNRISSASCCSLKLPEQPPLEQEGEGGGGGFIKLSTAWWSRVCLHCTMDACVIFFGRKMCEVIWKPCLGVRVHFLSSSQNVAIAACKLSRCKADDIRKQNSLSEWESEGYRIVYCIFKIIELPNKQYLNDIRSLTGLSALTKRHHPVINGAMTAKLNVTIAEERSINQLLPIQNMPFTNRPIIVVDL